LPSQPLDTATPLLSYNFQQGVADFFAAVGDSAPIKSLADVVAINNEDPENRAPYGQHFVEWSANTTTTPEEYERLRATAQAAANEWITTVLEQNDVDVLVYQTSYASYGGAAGIPALTVPAGLDANGRPQGIVLTGPYLSDPQLIAVGYALEQALDGRVEPDLEATMKMIEGVTQ
jgi:amidase